MSGPGGVGKSTIVEALVERDPRLWLSRSWTTRARREGEPDSAYVFVDRATFEQRIQDGGFVEWTEFLGNHYGTPTPEVPPDRDLVLEIEVDGARQIKALKPDALLIFVLPPTRDEQQRRLVGRGGPHAKVVQRLQLLLQENAIPHEGSPLGRVTFSAGIAAIETPDGPGPAELFEQADKALYECKRTGRNGIVRYDELTFGTLQSGSKPR